VLHRPVESALETSRWQDDLLAAWMTATGRVRLLAVSLYSGRSIIGLFKDADAPTPILESGHSWLEELGTHTSEEGAWA
jgi:hypothetical protein